MTEKYDWCYENSISYTKEYVDTDVKSNPRYSAFRTNRYLAKFIDTISQAQDMNLNAHLDPKLQYDYLFHSVRKKRRFAKGGKSETDKDIALIADFYNFSIPKARDALRVLTKEQLKTIKEMNQKGG